jgi:4-amino-4-deoxy-L-arabinose transferase-like glycosyltransferase
MLSSFVASRQSLVLFAILAIAAVVRLLNLDELGPFIDETGHLYAAVDYDFYPLLGRVQHGKVFGYMFFYPMAKWASDPFWTTRVVVALVGVATTAGIYFVLRRLANPVAAAIGGGIWALWPYVSFHDRMALHDPLITFFIVFATILWLRALERDARLESFGSGVLMGLAIGTKVSAAMYLLWFGFLLLASLAGGDYRRTARLFLFFVLGLVAPLASLASLIYTSLTNQNQFADQFLNDGGGTGSRLTLFVLNLQKVFTWFRSYSSVPFVVLAVLSLIFCFRRPWGLHSAAAVTFVAVVLVHCLTLKVFFARYLVPDLFFLLICVSLSLSAAWAHLASLRREAAPSPEVPVAQ